MNLELKNITTILKTTFRGKSSSYYINPFLINFRDGFLNIGYVRSLSLHILRFAKKKGTLTRLSRILKSGCNAETCDSRPDALIQQESGYGMPLRVYVG
jgi:hypothetical protein